MTKYLAIYHGAASDKQKQGLSDEESQVFMQAWAEWAQTHKEAFVDAGSPLSKTKLLTSEGASDTRNTMTGYAIVEADSHEEAVKIFSTHPHLTLVSSNSIEVIECPSILYD